MKKYLMSVLFVLFLAGTSFGQNLNLTWDYTQSTDPNAQADGFKIYRQVFGASWSLLSTITADKRAATDATVVYGTDYCYRMTAYNTAGESTYSNTACGAPAIFDGVSVSLRQGLTLAISRRATNGSSIVGLLVNKDEPVTINSAAEGGVDMTLRNGLTPAISRRATNGSSIVGILVNKDEPLRVNGVDQ